MKDALTTMGRLGNHDFMEKLNDLCFNDANVSNVKLIKTRNFVCICTRLAFPGKRKDQIRKRK